jgi:hypothetical protein
MFITADVYAVFKTWSALMFMICIRTEFHFPSQLVDREVRLIVIISNAREMVHLQIIHFPCFIGTVGITSTRPAAFFTPHSKLLFISLSTNQ